ncbi:MAG TPA: hypothetical protein DFS52_31795, partial [Myxococcales bacterium]|nr:hypothetical protein [Myxococcales bacterium]
MAKRKTQSARPVKRVLARQEVARAGRAAAPARAPSAARSSGSSYTLDIVALALFIAAVGTLAALLSFHREDATATRLANLIGPVGHALSFKLFGTLGVCAYLVPIAMAYSSVALFVRGRAKRRGRQIAGVLILALAGAVLAHLLVGSTSVLSYPPGGAVGAALGESLRALFSTFGSVLVTFAVAAAGLVLATDSAFARLCVALGRLTRDGAVAAWRLGLAEGRKGLATYKLRRAQRLQERAEEEAAFAQALADAEELEGERMYALAR